MGQFDSQHETVRDYAAARAAGDQQAAEQIKSEAIARFETRTTDGTELGDMLRASFEVPFGQQD